MLSQRNIFTVYGVLGALYGLWFFLAPAHGVATYMGQQDNLEALSRLMQWFGLFVFALAVVYFLHRDTAGAAARFMSVLAVVVALVAIYLSYTSYQASGNSMQLTTIGLNVVYILLFGSLLMKK